MPGLCEVCGIGDMIFGDNATLYCRNCGAQAANYIEEAFDAEDGYLYNAAFTRERGVGVQVAPKLDENIVGEFPHGVAGADSEGSFGVWTVGEDGRPQYRHRDPNVFQHDGQFGEGTPATRRIPEVQVANSIRRTYVAGLQRIIQLQCESLVRDFNVTPLVCGIVGPIWLRYVAHTRVFENVWADEAIEVAEHHERVRKRNSRRLFKGAEVCADRGTMKPSGQKQRGVLRPRQPRRRKGGVLQRTSYGRKSSSVWLDALKERLPVTATLALSYLACYIAREPVLPTDICKWASKGLLPYLNAFVEISRPAQHHVANSIGEKLVFPMDPRLMFQPLSIVGARTVEHQAAFIAERVGLQLPSVNFHSIFARFLRDLGLPLKELSAYACRLFEWYTPSGLWLSAREEALPTRVYVMAMLIITVKILYKLDNKSPQVGREKKPQETQDALRSKDKGSCCVPSVSQKMLTRVKGATDMASADTKQQQPGASEMFQGEAKYLGNTKWLLEKLSSINQISSMDYEEQLSNYLKYCQDVIFPGYDLEAGFEYARNQFWGIYENSMAQVASKLGGDSERAVGSSLQNPDHTAGSLVGVGGPEGNAVMDLRTQNLSILVRDMRNAGFSYLPPNLGRLGLDEYLRYSFHLSDEDLMPVHEDYFHVLQACGRVVNVHERALHWCVQIVEQGLLQMETNVERLLVQRSGDVAEPGRAVKRRQPFRKRDKIFEAENAKIDLESVQHLTSFDYI